METCSVVLTFGSVDEILMMAVLEIKKKNRLSLFQKPGNQTCEFSCPDESLVAR